MAKETLTLIPKITWRDLIENKAVFKNFDLGDLTYSYTQPGGHTFTGDLVIKKSFQNLNDTANFGPDVLVLDGLEESSGKSFDLTGKSDGTAYKTKQIGFVLFQYNDQTDWGHAVSPDDPIPTDITSMELCWYPVVLEFTPPIL